MPLQRFDIHAAGSIAAGEHNEDAYGHHETCLWVLDGATGVTERACTEGPTDAAWLARATSEAVRHASHAGLPLRALLHRVEDEVAARFRAQPGAAAGEIDMPTTCLGIVRIDGDAIELTAIGDIAIAVAVPGAPVHVYSDDTLAPFAARTMAALEDAMRATADRDEIWRRLRPLIHENRDAANRPGGYRVVHPGRPWAAAADIHRLPALPGTTILMASDGLWRLVDLFGAHAPHALLHAVREEGLDALFARLRAMEVEDAACARYLRVKVSDDATGLAATLVSD